MVQIANSLGHIKDVRIEHGPPGDSNQPRTVKFGEDQPSREDKKKRKKQGSGQRVLGLQDGNPNSPRNSAYKMKIVQ